MVTKLRSVDIPIIPLANSVSLLNNCENIAVMVIHGDAHPIIRAIFASSGNDIGFKINNDKKGIMINLPEHAIYVCLFRKTLEKLQFAMKAPNNIIISPVFISEIIFTEFKITSGKSTFNKNDIRPKKTIIMHGLNNILFKEIVDLS